VCEWSRHDLAMTWEQRASVVNVFYNVLKNVRSSLEVHVHEQHADLCICECIFTVTGLSMTKQQHLVDQLENCVKLTRNGRNKTSVDVRISMLLILTSWQPFRLEV
jgi:hypothetical protein